MKKLIYITFVILGFSSCNMDLEPVIDNTYGDDFAFGLPVRTEGFLMNAYANIPNTVTSAYSGDFLDAATDNAVTNNFGAIYRIGSGGLTVQTDPIGGWDNAYNQFRNIHIFLERGLGPNVIYNLNDPDADMAKRINLKGEAFFLRAWWGFQLLQQFGGKTNTGDALGYAIVLNSLSSEEAADLDSFSRNTYEECVAQITQDLDSAFLYLPFEYSGNDPIFGIQNLGRANKQTTLALKARLGIYAASPAYQPDDVVRLDGMGQYSVVNGQSFQDKWVRAAEYAQEAIELIGDFSGLTPNDFNANITPQEFLFRNYHNDRALEVQNYPIRQFGNARLGPSQNLVNSFPMANGYPINDPRSNFDPNNPYEGRDPRLAWTVLYNGVELNGSPIEVFEGGRDSRSSNPQNTRTGYYLRKWLSVQPGLTDVENPGNDHHYHVLLRRTEIFLNLAEASNEAYGPMGFGPGQSQSALEIIKSIRSNAGIQNHSYIEEMAAAGKEEFRKVIQNERRIELAFENHRYFDMRRWLLPLNEDVMGVMITPEEDGEFNYEYKSVEKRNFNEVKYYYLPIPYNEVVKSPNLVNNLGW